MNRKWRRLIEKGSIFPGFLSLKAVPADAFKIELYRFDPVAGNLFNIWGERNIIVDIVNLAAGLAIKMIME